MVHNDTHATVVGSANSYNVVFIGVMAADCVMHIKFPVVPECGRWTATMRLLLIDMLSWVARLSKDLFCNPG